mgnify:CR=1 FL=1
MEEMGLVPQPPPLEENSRPEELVEENAPVLIDTEESKRYLRKHLEPDESPEQFLEGLELKRSLDKRHTLEGNIESRYAYGEGGAANAKIGSLDSIFSYESVRAEDIPEGVARILQKWGNEETSEANTRRLTSFELEVPGSPARLNVTDLLPEDYRIFINAERDVSASWVNRGERYIYLGTDVTTPGGVMTLLHEVGHTATEYKRTDKEEARYKTARKQNNDLKPGQYEKPSSEAMALVLKDERDAWAFALKKIRPLLTKETSTQFFDREVIEKYIHQTCLSSYSDEMREYVDKDGTLKVLFGKFLDLFR